MAPSGGNNGPAGTMAARTMAALCPGQPQPPPHPTHVVCAVGFIKQGRCPDGLYGMEPGLRLSGSPVMENPSAWGSAERSGLGLGL